MIRLSQANELFDILQQHLLKPVEFEKRIYQGALKEYFYITHRETKYEFEISLGNKSMYSLSITPGLKAFTEYYAPDSWEDVTNMFHFWCREMQKEVSAKDKWSQLLENKIDIEEPFKNSDKHFQSDELKELRNRLDLLIDKISKLDLKEDHVQILISNINYTYTLATDNSFSKKDWFFYFLGLITTVITSLGLTAENVTLIKEFLSSTFSSFIELPY